MPAITVQRLLTIPAPSSRARAGEGRSLAGIARQPTFVIAVQCGAVSYGVMNLLMTATPLAMHACEYPFKEATLVMNLLFSGALLTLQGWERLDVLAVPFLRVVGAELLWLAVPRRSPLAT